MALIVETGSAAPDAESYASVTDLVDYAAKTGQALTASNEEQEAALRKASAYIDGEFLATGHISTHSQALGWPRHYAFDPEGRRLTGIPAKLIAATSELALKALAAPLYDTDDPGIIRKSESTEGVGAQEVEFDRPKPVRKRFPEAEAMLAQVGMRLRYKSSQIARG